MENNKRFFGIIGAIVGGLIAAIPWVILYVYGNLITSVLAILIAIGALKGYQLAKGKIDKYVPIIIATISILVIALCTLIIVPCLLMAKEDIIVNFTNLKILYNYEPFTKALFGDLILSVVFALIGISGVVKNLKGQLNSGATEVSAIYDNSNILLVKKIFDEYQAFDKSSAIDRDLIISQLNEENKENILADLEAQNIIIQHDGKYYYNKKIANKNLKSIVIWTAVFIVIMVIVILL